MAEVMQPRSPPAEASTSAHNSSAAGEAWKVLGRDTPAGKALYRLYGNDFHGKTAGDAYHGRNKAVHEAKLATGWSPSKPEKSNPVFERPTVMYPKFGKDRAPKEVAVAAIPRRKPGDQILREMEEERERQRAHRPNPRGPLLDEKEKERCAVLMRYRGKVPAVTPEDRAAAALAARRVKKSEREELQDLFNQVMTEIEERKEFLRDLERNGALKRETQQQVRNEIKQRVEDLEKIDALMRGAEDRARAAPSASS